MRISTNNYYKNFNTNEQINLTKFKPEQNMINECKIELFDNLTGKKTEECVGENIVGNIFNKYAIYYLSMMSLFNYDEQSYYIPNLFSTIALTDNTSSEDANMRYIKGNVIGWSNKFDSYGGADPKRGTINFAESKVIDKNSIKYVFDFPTNCANGTFQSIYWMAGSEIDNTYECYQPEMVIAKTIYYGGILKNFPSSSYFGSVFMLDNEIYYMSTSQLYKVRTNGITLAKTESILLAKLKNIDPFLCGIQFDGTYYWSYGRVNQKVYKFDTSFNLVDSWSLSDTYVSAYCQFVYYKSKLFFIKYVDATHINLYKFSLTGTLENTYNLLTGSGNFNTYVTKSDNIKMLKVEDNLFIYHVSTGTNVRSNSYSVIEVNENGNILADYGMYSVSLGTIVAYNTDYKILEDNNGYGFIMHKEPSSHVLLPAPITKTNANYMKLSFTFNLDLTNLF